MKPTKSLAALLSAAIVCLLIVSCGAKNADAVSVYSPRQIAEIIIAGQNEIPELTLLALDEPLFTEYLLSNYLLDAGDFKDGAVYYAFGVEASEITVLLLNDGADIKKTTDALAEYQERRTAALTGYVPVQADLVERGVVVSNGAYAALLICEDASAARSAFLSCFGNDPPGLPGNPPLSAAQSPDDAAGNSIDSEAQSDDAAGAHRGDEQSDVPGVISEPAEEYDPDPGPDDEQPDAGKDEDSAQPDEPAGEQESVGGEDEQPPGIPEKPDNSGSPTENGPEAKPDPSEPPEIAEPFVDAFDPDTILIAWNTGVTASLSEKNKAILNACIEVIGAVITNGMTDYQKELAIHDWIVKWASYDTEANNNSPTAKPSPDNDNPYGLLFNKKAICSGYTSTFQLFMDMLGIECITVNGYARNRETEHAWNMVRLDGEWYCVDVTWDDPSGLYPPGFISHEYFNVTSQYLRDHQHIWDDGVAPEATATAYSWENMENG